jgi:hypothetical protein
MQEQGQRVVYTVSNGNPSTNIEPTAPALLQYGGSSVAIILAVAVLLKAVAEMIKALVPVMLQQSNDGRRRK